MRATTQRMALLETLGKVKSAVAAKHTLPVCSSVLLRAGGGQLTLVGTDLEVALTASCKAAIGRQGAVAAPPKDLEAFLKLAKAETVTLTLVGDRSLRIEAGSAATTLEGYAAENFPKLPGAKGMPVNVNGLADALRQISYAVAKEDQRPVLTGVLFNPKNGKVALVGSDGYRLAETTVKVKGKLEQTVVPRKAVLLIQKLMPGKITIHRNEKNISFVGEGLVLTTEIIQGAFPNYEQLIPKGGSAMTVDTAALKDALRTVAVTLPENRAIRLMTRAGKLMVSTKSNDRGQTEVKVPAKGKVKIAFDANFLKDLLSKAGDHLTLRTKDAHSPGVVKQNGTVHVVMPLFVEW